MACRGKTRCMVSITLVLAKLVMMVGGEPRVRCYFVFGDSIVDNGNNNGLNTTAKVNYLPYGIDYPDGPTGRFSNGRNLADFIAEFLGFRKPIPPFATAKSHDLLGGVNYASGGAGILPETGRQLGEVISLGRQLVNHKSVVSRVVALYSSKSRAEELLSKCLYTVGMGSNDFINNYFAPEYFNTSREFTPAEYVASLGDQYSRHLINLYKLGARKVAVFGLGPIGCTPAEESKFGTDGGSCIDEINNAVELFNNRLVTLVDDLNSNLTDAKFVYVSSSSSNVPSAGVAIVTNAPCCKTSSEDGTRGQCLANKQPCPIRLQYSFFDGFHPTETTSFLIATSAYISIAELL